jgi:hypothetical protein
MMQAAKNSSNFFQYLSTCGGNTIIKSKVSKAIPVTGLGGLYGC